MPELPEVQTTVAGLQKVLPYLYIKDVWTDLATADKRQKESVKTPAYFSHFKNAIKDKRILEATRRGKNILIHLEGGKTILIHMKMTGHLLFGEYTKNEIPNTKTQTPKEIWVPKEKGGPLHDPYNRFIHVVFTLSDPSKKLGENIRHLVFSDARKFGKIALLDTAELTTSVHLAHIGPEPLDKKFTKQEMILALTKKPNGKIKPTLMDQSVIAGIGNIYSDEILWEAGVNPKERVKDIPLVKFGKMFEAMKEILSKGIDFGGDSTSDYRDISGRRGKFQHHHHAYQRAGEKCGKPGCKGVILREVIAGRSAHYCFLHQKLLKKK